MVYVARGGIPQAKYVEGSDAEKQMGYNCFTGTNLEWSNTLANQAWDLLEPKVGWFMGACIPVSSFCRFQVDALSEFVLFGMSGGASTMAAFAHLLLSKGVYLCWCCDLTGAWAFLRQDGAVPHCRLWGAWISPKPAPTRSSTC
jgi:hypothetical protein